MVIDAQVHVWDRDQPDHRWDPAITARSDVYASFMRLFTARTFTAEEALAQMDAAGVAGALLVSPIVYGDDPGYCLAAARRHPERFRVVGRIDAGRADVAEVVSSWRDEPSIAGARVTAVTEGELEAARRGLLDRLLRAAGDAGLPVCLYAPGALGLVGELAARYPSTMLVLDHLGLRQPPYFGPADPWLELPDLLALAPHGNIAVKLTAAPAYSKEPYPFGDLWPRIHEIAAAFGIERLMWGSDISQHPALPYGQAVDYLFAPGALSRRERELVLGENLRRTFGWH